MPGQLPPGDLAAFAGFELDVRTGELCRAGQVTARLSEQPLQILILLLRSPAQLVTREDLRRQLWPNDTVVEFEHSISAAMNRLRTALGDSAKNPQYIETLARKGYRWRIPVEWRRAAADPQAAAQLEKPAPGGEWIGRKVSPYRVLSVLGGGGMGIVYRAEDLKLGRAVALKFLPEELANDPIAMQRFSREARAASALNHPNICTIHEVEEHEGQSFLVMELLEGKTLRDVIAESASRSGNGGAAAALPMGEIVGIAIQICDGLIAAHDKEIIHRDLKPANIFLTSSGTAKLLDFGLAKQSFSAEESEDQRSSRARQPQRSHAVTVTGTTVGTAGYMSPEQIRCEPLDGRSDLFSLGLVLYELTAGVKAFSGKSAAELRGQVLERVITPARALNSKIPRELDGVIQRLTQKDRDARFPSARELRPALLGIQAKLLSGQKKRNWKWWASWAAAIVLTGAAFVWSARNLRSAGHNKETWRQRQLTVNTNENPVIGGAISPNGKYLAYSDADGLQVRPVEGGDSVRIADPETYRLVQHRWELGTWLADSTHFFALAEQPQKPPVVWLLSISGEEGRRIMENANPWGATADGSLVALTKNDDHEVWLAQIRGGNATRILDGGATSRFRAISFSPDGRRLAYIRNTIIEGRNQSHIEMFDRQNGTTHELASGEEIKVVSELEEGFQDLIWFTNERVIFIGGVPDIHGVSCNLWELRLDGRTAERRTAPNQLTDWAGFCVTNLSKTGDGRALVFSRSSDLVTVFAADYDAMTRSMGTPRRMTLTDDLSSALGWSGDGHALYIRSNRDGKWRIFRQELQSGKAEGVYDEEEGASNVTLTPDNRSVLYQKYEAGDPGDSTRLMHATLPQTAGETVRKEIFRGRNYSVACGRSPHGLCVIGEIRPEKKLVFSRLDVERGRGEILATASGFDPEKVEWVLSPDGTEVAFHEDYGKEYFVLSLRDQTMRRVALDGEAYLRTMTWSAKGDALFASSAVREGAQLLLLDRQGRSKKLWQLDGGNTYLRAEPSPDGKHVAMDGSFKSSNLWILEGL